MEPLLAGLNDAQRSAVTSPASVLQVLAPPGSGKTKTLTARVAYLISYNGFHPWNIIVCTFTIKAAREMKERIRGLVGDGIEAKLILGTFHSVARRFLAFYGHHIGIDKNFGIADSSDSLAMIKRIIKRNGFSAEPSASRSRISGLKAKGTSCDEYASSSKKIEHQEFASIYMEYEDTLKASNLLDYDDLLLRCAELLRKHPECVSNVQAVLIDEFQDTNHIQFELMNLFAQRNKTITIVGDPDQSIYGFRSAEIKNLTRMQQIYPETVVVILEENYRSSGAILMSAMEVIMQDESRPNKKLLSTHCPGERPVLRKLPSAAAEASWIVSEIKRSQTLTGQLFTLNDFAILLRSAALSRQIETALGKAGIPYRMVGGHKFYDRVEVKIILDYLRVINQPDHNNALVRIINVPSRKIGEVTVKGLLEEAEAKKVTLWELILKAAQGNGKPKTKMSSQAEKGLESFVNLVLTSRRKLVDADKESCSILDILGHLLKRLSYEEYLRKFHPEDFDGRWANVEELILQATEMASAIAEGNDPTEETLPVIAGIGQREASSAEDVLNRFLANVALATDIERAEGGQAAEQVTISTIHAAKGLEWPVVFIPAAYEGSIPHSRSEDTDEERRLLYVGMTRAQSLLYLSCPVKNSQREQTTLSPFLCSRRMGQLFDVKGPSFRFTVTQDLARILRRPCPPDAIIQEARSLVERIEDDLWPLDGEENDPENTYWSLWGPNKGGTLSESGFKRRKVDRSDTKVAVTSVATAMTTQEEMAYSVSSTTMASGFVSAGAHMQVLEQQRAYEVASKKIKPELEKDNHESKATTTAKAAKKRPIGQGSIASFFGKPASVTSQSLPPAPRVTLPSQVAQRLHSGSSVRITASQPSTLRDTSNFVTHSVRPSVPLLTRSASNHRPRTTPLLGRPRRSTPEVEEASKRYILLSSSPAKADSDDEVNNKGTPASVEPIKQHSRPVNDFKPASTFHNTSMVQQAPPKKTLGMRRSLQGWSVKSQQMPRPRQ